MGLGIKQFKGLTSGVKVSPWDAASEFLNQLDQAATQASLDSINTDVADVASAVAGVAANQVTLGSAITAARGDIASVASSVASVSSDVWSGNPGGTCGASYQAAFARMWQMLEQLTLYQFSRQEWAPHFLVFGKMFLCESDDPPWDFTDARPSARIGAETVLEMLTRLHPEVTWSGDFLSSGLVGGGVYDGSTGSSMSLYWAPFPEVSGGMTTADFLEACRYTPSAGADRNALTDALVMLPDALISMGWSGHV